MSCILKLRKEKKMKTEMKFYRRDEVFKLIRGKAGEFCIITSALIQVHKSEYELRLNYESLFIEI